MAEGDVVDVAFLPRDARAELPMCPDVPQAHRLVLPSRGEQRAVAAERHRGYRAEMAGQRSADLAVRGGVPQPDGVVVARGREQLAVGAERDIVDRLLVPGERRADLRLRHPVPEADRAVAARRGDGLAVGAEGHARHLRGVAREHAERVVRRRSQDCVARLERRRQAIGTEAQHAGEPRVAGFDGARRHELGLGDMGLRDRTPALDKREGGQAERDHQRADDPAGERALPTRRGAAALDDVRGLVGGGLLAMAALVRQPGLRVVQVGAAQQEAPVALGVEPFAAAGGQPSVLVAPLHVGLDRLHESPETPLEVVAIAQVDPLGVADDPGHRVLVHVAADDGTISLLRVAASSNSPRHCGDASE